MLLIFSWSSSFNFIVHTLYVFCIVLLVVVYDIVLVTLYSVWFLFYMSFYFFIWLQSASVTLSVVKRFINEYLIDWLKTLNSCSIFLYNQLVWFIIKYLQD